jgi:hypothetical protein
MGWKTAASLCFWGLLERAQASEESENVKVARFTSKPLDCTQHRSTCFVERNGLCSRNLGLELGTQSYPFRSVLGWRAYDFCVLVYSGTATCKWVYEENNETLEWITEWHLDTQNYCWQQMVGTTMPHLNFLESTYLLLEPSLMQSIPDGTAFPDLCFHITIFMS